MSRTNNRLLQLLNFLVDVACSRFGYPIYQQLRQEYAAASNEQLRVWRCSHFG